MLGVDNATFLIYFQVLTVAVVEIRLSNFVHHEILFVFNLTKHHCKDRKKLRKLIHVNIGRKVPIEDLVVRPTKVVALKYVDHF